MLKIPIGTIIVVNNEQEENELRQLLQINGYWEDPTCSIEPIFSKAYRIHLNKQVLIYHVPCDAGYMNLKTFKEQYIFKEQHIMKEIKINVPEGYEIDSENSTFECVKFKPKQQTFNYDYVASELFCNDYVCYLDEDDIKEEYNGRIWFHNKTNATSKKQLEKLLAINQLMNVAKYLNDGWKPCWDGIEEDKFYFVLNDNNIKISSTRTWCRTEIYFKTIELAEQAIKILGEDTIRLVLSTDW